MSHKFETEEVNLLSMSLADLTEEQLADCKNLYVLTAMLHPEEKEIIGFFEGVKKLTFFNQRFKDFLTSLIPFMVAYGIGKIEVSELTALGLKVGHKNKSEIDEEEEE